MAIEQPAELLKIEFWGLFHRRWTSDASRGVADGGKGYSKDDWVRLEEIAMRLWPPSVRGEKQMESKIQFQLWTRFGNDWRLATFVDTREDAVAAAGQCFLEFKCDPGRRHLFYRIVQVETWGPIQ